MDSCGLFWLRVDLVTGRKRRVYLAVVLVTGFPANATPANRHTVDCQLFRPTVNGQRTTANEPVNYVRNLQVLRPIV